MLVFFVAPSCLAGNVINVWEHVWLFRYFRMIFMFWILFWYPYVTCPNVSSFFGGKKAIAAFKGQERRWFGTRRRKPLACCVRVQYADVCEGRRALRAAPHWRAGVLGASLLIAFTLAGWLLLEPEILPVVRRAYRAAGCTERCSGSSQHPPLSEALPGAGASHQLHWEGSFVKVSLVPWCFPSPRARRWDSWSFSRSAGNSGGRKVESPWGEVDWDLCCSRSALLCWSHLLMYLLLIKIWWRKSALGGCKMLLCSLFLVTYQNVSWPEAMQLAVRLWEPSCTKQNKEGTPLRFVMAYVWQDGKQIPWKPLGTKSVALLQPFHITES